MAAQRTMGPVVMVTSCPPAPAPSALKQPSEHSNREAVLLHEEADLRLRALTPGPCVLSSSSLGMWPRDLECLGGRGGGQRSGPVTSRISGLLSLLPDTGAGILSSVWVPATIRCFTGVTASLMLDVRSVQESAEDGSRDRREGEVKFLLVAVRSGLCMREELLRRRDSEVREAGGGSRARGWGAYL